MPTDVVCIFHSHSLALWLYSDCFVAVWKIACWFFHFVLRIFLFFFCLFSHFICGTINLFLFSADEWFMCVRASESICANESSACATKGGDCCCLCALIECIELLKFVANSFPRPCLIPLSPHKQLLAKKVFCLFAVLWYGQQTKARTNRKNWNRGKWEKMLTTDCIGPCLNGSKRLQKLGGKSVCEKRRLRGKKRTNFCLLNKGWYISCPTKQQSFSA